MENIFATLAVPMTANYPRHGIVYKMQKSMIVPTNCYSHSLCYCASIALTADACSVGLFDSSNLRMSRTGPYFYSFPCSISIAAERKLSHHLLNDFADCEWNRLYHGAAFDCHSPKYCVYASAYDGGPNDRTASSEQRVNVCLCGMW